MNTKSEMSAPDPRRRHDAERDEFDRDLTPDPVGGQHPGAVTPDREVPTLTAYDHKELHRRMVGWTDDELKQIPVLERGTRLQEGRTYADLARDRPQAVTAHGRIEVDRGHLWVPKDRVPYELWNRLIGEAKPGQEGPGVPPPDDSLGGTAR